MLKPQTSKFGRGMDLQLRNGRLSIRIRWVMKHTKPRDLTHNSVSKSMNHSTSDLRCQCRELWKSLELATLFSRDG